MFGIGVCWLLMRLAMFLLALSVIGEAIKTVIGWFTKKK